MRNRSGIQGVASSPILVGAVTVLVVIVAVFLAYNANNGLPFVTTYDLKARVPNANALVKNNEVRVGGVRVGIVREVRPIQLGDGRVAAELSLQLDQSVEPLAVDSTITIRPKSALGLKFLQLSPGDSSETLAAGDTIPLSSYKPEPVDIDQFFDMFDEPTRKAIQRSQAGFGNAFAGRGPQLNEGIGALRLLAENSQQVLRTIVQPSTDFDGFWRALEDLSATVAPVAETQADLFVALDRTFAAFARVSRPYIQETIEKGPRTLDAVNADLPAVRPFFRSSERFFTALKPGAKALAETSPTIAAALKAGVPALNASPVVNNQLQPTAEALVDFQNSPGVFNGLDLLIDLNRKLKPALTFIAPAQTTCNYATLTFRNLVLSTSGGNELGNWLNATTFTPPVGPNAESGPSSAPANGGGSTPTEDRKNHLHYNPYPYTASPGQPRICAAGNEKYTPGQTAIGNPKQTWATTVTDRQVKGQAEGQ